MKFQLLLAGRTVEIESDYHAVYDLCWNYLIRDSQNIRPDITIRITKDDIENERLLLKGNTIDTEPMDKKSELYMSEQIESVLTYRKIADAMLAYDTVLIHGAVISTKNKGYMFSAPQGVGKTTRAILWYNNIPGSRIINGDKPLVKICDEGVFAYGTPWCGKERTNCNTVVPLKAIFLIERADEDRENIVEELPVSRALSLLIPQFYFPERMDSMLKILELIKVMGNHVKFYRFKSEPTAEAVEIAYRKVYSL